MLRRDVEFVGLRAKLSRELAKFFLREQIDGVAACRPAAGGKSAEIVGGHDPPPKAGPHVIWLDCICYWFPARGVRVTRRNHMMLRAIRRTRAEQTATTNSVILITRI